MLCIDESGENNQIHPEYLSALQSSLLYWFNLNALIVVFRKEAVLYLLSIKQQTDTVRDQLVNTVEHLKRQIFPSLVRGD